MKQTGTDISLVSRIPEGATIKRAYWALPDNGTIGPEFTDESAALRVAIDAKEAAVAKHNEFYPNVLTRMPLPETITLDYRWLMDYPGGGSIDFDVSRFVYENLTEAREALNRLERFATN